MMRDSYPNCYVTPIRQQIHYLTDFKEELKEVKEPVFERTQEFA